MKRIIGRWPGLRSGIRPAGFTGIFLGLLILFSGGALGRSYTSDDCTDCHETGSAESSLEISPQAYDTSAHGRALACLDCHARIVDEDHMDGADPVDCSRCHDTAAKGAGLAAFRIASHPKADFSRNFGMENCLGCHQGTGMHGETGPVNGQDCHKCHAPYNPDRIVGTMHADTGSRTAHHLFFGGLALVLCLGPVLRKRMKQHPAQRRNHP